jgi:hypothetical protein
MLALSLSAVADKLRVVPHAGEEIGANLFELVPANWGKKLFVVCVGHTFPRLSRIGRAAISGAFLSMAIFRTFQEQSQLKGIPIGSTLNSGRSKLNAAILIGYSL